MAAAFCFACCCCCCCLLLLSSATKNVEVPQCTFYVACKIDGRLEILGKFWGELLPQPLPVQCAAWCLHICSMVELVWGACS
jgi:hypothetical protein